jgi:cytochrome c-type biogenesis protein
MDISLGLAFLGGLLSFLSPCVLPLVPAYIGYLGGRVTQTVAAQNVGGSAVAVTVSLADRLSTALHGLAFIAGFTTIFVLLGLATTIFVQIIGGQNIRLVTDALGRIGGVFLIFLGLQIIDFASILAKRKWSSSRWLTLLIALLALGIIGDIIVVNLSSLRGMLPEWALTWSGATVIFWILPAWFFLSGVLRDLPIMRNTISIILFSIIAARLILWMAVDLLIALPILALLLLWLFLWNALDSPATFWERTCTALQSLFYADTRRQFTGGNQSGIGGSFFMGVVFSAGWTPCIGPIYGGILTLAATTGNIGLASAQLLAYSLGLGVPFLLAALMLDGTQTFLRRLQRQMRTIKLLSGALLLIIGIAIASGRLQELSRDYAQQFADFSYNLENCTLSIINGERTLNEFGGCMQGQDTRPAASR